MFLLHLITHIVRYNKTVRMNFFVATIAYVCVLILRAGESTITLFALWLSRLAAGLGAIAHLMIRNWPHTVKRLKMALHWSILVRLHISEVLWLINAVRIVAWMTLHSLSVVRVHYILSWQHLRLNEVRWVNLMLAVGKW